jgi:hypothetical protein
MKTLIPLFLLAATPAFADNGPAGHAHPHGLEGVLLGLVALAVAWGVWRAAR